MKQEKHHVVKPYRIAMVDLGIVWGGQEIYSAALMKALKQQGHRVFSFSYLEKFASLDVPREQMRADYSGFTRAARRLAAVQEEADIIHFNGNRALYLSKFVPKIMPFVGTKHLPYGIDVKGHTRILGSALAPFLFSKIDAMISVCRATKDELPKSLQARTTVIPNGVPSCLTPDVKRSTTFTLVYVARLARSKGIMDALQAVLQLRKEGLEFRFLIAGDGEMRVEAEQFVMRHGLADIVTFLGFVSEVGSIYSQAHACVLPSRHEGMPLNLLEALSAACPVLAYDIPGVNEVIEHGKNGLIPQQSINALTNALRQLITNSALQQSLAKGALNSYENNFRLEHMMARTIAVYRSVAA